MIRLVSFFIGFQLLCTVAIFSQTLNPLETARNVLIAEQKKLGLLPEDVESFVILDNYRSVHNDVWHIYINQTFQGILIDQAVININLNERGELIHLGNQFVRKLKDKIIPIANTISPAESVIRFSGYLGQSTKENLFLKKKNTQNHFKYKKTSFSRGDIGTQLFYKADETDKLVPAWKVEFVSNESDASWVGWIHAGTGDLLEYDNVTLYCDFHEDTYRHPEKALLRHNTLTVDHQMDEAGTSPQYRVFPLPVESPLHGDQLLIQGPDSNQASPFGWHDTDGVTGPEFFITRGNNVHAFEDQDGDEDSAGNEPNGGELLMFDFVFDPLTDPQLSLDAIVTNLFYTNNYMHDFAYRFGFNEVSGNFQENNYGKGGMEGDYIIAQALSFEEDDEGQPISNNASFTPSSDGSFSWMNMYLWNISAGANRIQITSPEEISGSLESSEAIFGTPVGSTPVSGKVVITDDGTSHLTDACHDIINDSEVIGNIALIDRGICEFGSKVLNAENNGAIAALICNVAGVNGGTGDELLSGGMGAGVDGADVTIPSLFLKKSDCDLIKAVIKGGTDVIVNLELVNPPAGPSQLSSSLDNGIIAHEYAHGISTRLTGGSASSFCLNNDEQMGEGWSDFFTLIVTQRDGDTGFKPRGIGNYVIRGRQDGRGIRRFHYSTDMSVNPLTYNSIRGTTSPHSLGEVWTACLWDMYWRFIDLYGFDHNWVDESSGNFRAVQLVIDGMKFQKCRPGFVDGRDAILAADQALYDGVHQCMIWEVFSGRGVGFDAVQGSSSDRNDNEEGFEPLPTCVKELKIGKTASEIVEAGETIDVEIRIVNHKDEVATDVIFTETMEERLTFFKNFSGYPETVEGQNLIFEIGTMESQEEVVFSYQLLTDPLFISTSLIFDNFESESITLIQFPLQQDNFEWQLVDFDAFSGNRSWFIPNDTTLLDQGLVTTEPILVQGEKPVLKFVHKYDTEFGFDGGFLEFSKDGGSTWEFIRQDQFLKNGYNSTLDFFTFAIPGLLAFTGNSQGWIESFVDLSDFMGQEILIRFRFGCDASSNPPGENKGWYIDDFEILDLVSYSGNEACVSSAEGDYNCDVTSTIVRTPGNTTPVEEVPEILRNIQIFPNPANEMVYIRFEGFEPEAGLLILSTIDGKVIHKSQIDIHPSDDGQPFNISFLPDGLYWVQLITTDYRYIKKLVKQ